MITIDLQGPQGNAFVLLGLAEGWAKQMGMDFEPIHKDATSGDYDHLVAILRKHFGRLATFEYEENEDE